jgi:hypothetical protein
MVTDDKDEFDYLGYESALERVLEQATRDYWAQYIDINRHQVDVAKNYLWVSGALLGAYFTCFTPVKASLSSMSPCLILMGLMAAVLAVSAFGICLYALPSRKGYMRVGQSWGTFSKRAYDDLAGKKRSVYRDTLTSLVDKFDEAAMHNLNTNNHRARLLRITSWVLIASFCLALLAASGYGIQTYFGDTKEGAMAEQEATNPQGSPNSGNQDTPAVAKPDAIPPAGPVGTNPSNVITHGLDTSKPQVIIIEGKDKKAK